MMRTKPVIIFICVAAIAVLLYYYFKKNKMAIPIFSALTSKPELTVTSAVTKRYATWLDKIEEIAKKMKAGTLKAATKELTYNAEELAKLSDDSLKAVITYWEAARNRSITTFSAFVNFYDESGSTLDLFNRVRNLKYFETK